MLPVFIFPGFSQKNLDWARLCQKNLPDSTIFEWQHWQTKAPTPDWIEQEAQLALAKIGSQKINILAKSMGTAVAGLVITKIPEQINQLIFCGIPINDFQPNDLQYYQFLKNFPSYKVLCLQNDKDPHGKHAQVKDLFTPLNPSLEIMMTTRPDHEYPYFADFLNFFA